MHWVCPAIIAAPTANGSAADPVDTAHQRGRLWLLTGDVPAFWSAMTAPPGSEQHTRLPELSFADRFGDQRQAASVPLLAHPDATGRGARPPAQ